MAYTYAAFAKLSRNSMDEMKATNSKRTQEQRSEDSRQRIIEAAIEEFGNLGFSGARMRTIAAKAGVVHTLVAYHFQSKENLWIECANSIEKAFTEALLDAMERSKTKDSGSMLKQLIKSIVVSAARNPHVHRFAQRFSLENGQSSGKRRRTSSQTGSTDIVLKVIEDAQKDGVLPAGIEPIALRFIIGGAATLVYVQPAEYEARTGRDPRQRDESDAFIEALWKVFIPERKP